MKDPVFAGKDVADAVRVASRTLAVPESVLRYVVLDPGQPGGRGLSPTEARIAVLIERLVAGGGTPTAPASGPEEDVDWSAGRGRRPQRGAEREASHEGATTDDPEAALRAVVQEIARASGVELTVAVSDGRESLEVQVGGTGARVFFDPRGEALGALEHVIERLYGRGLAGRRVRLRCEGYRDYRDELLREEALGLAQQVRADGQARTTAPLNAYERRVIHVALEGREDVTTFSVGEGRARRVTVAVKEAGGDRDQAATTPPAQATAAAATSAPGAEPASREEAPRVAEPGRATTAAASFDPRKFDRPPQGGGASELM